MHPLLLSRAHSAFRTPRSSFIIYPLAIISCLLLSSCSSPPTAYQPVSRDGGYTQTKTGPTAYTVSFIGNPETPYPRAYDFAVLRAAEIGSQLGFTWFAIEGQADNSQRQVVQSPTTTQTFGTIGPGGTFIGNSIYFPNQTTEFRPGVQLSITYYSAKPAGAFLTNSLCNVADTLASLRAKYNLSANLTPLLAAPGNTTAGNTTVPQG
jgi:hypothetical protein